ncbi:REP-associated tyrosine transposase [Shimia sagamensis]|uniref:Transposase n=1 Tax=Shimia sagamensis TaxID=1566352 RepID=A0ABY1P7Z3_9RHOB|nr:transposase [Shimia sagamensis]SMP28596.1 putative transposase [Shimia sagamensis]
MSHYIRPKVPGATVFFTVNLAARGGDLLVQRIDALREAVFKTHAERRFYIDAWVVMPDHMHAVWTLPRGDSDYARRWQIIKARFSRSVPKGVQRSSHVARRERAVWQRRFWEHHIRDAESYKAAITYCHMNPVKHGCVQRAEEWPYSSVHRDIACGRWV